jgi:hypothetical protein
MSISIMRELNAMTSIMSEIKSMSYFRNYQATTGHVHNIASHEEAVACVLNNNGLTSLNMKFQRNEKIDLIINNDKHSKIAKMSYVMQPFGTHNSPDFIVKCENTVFGLECKSSSNTNTPMYNSGGVTPHYIYIFCSKQSNQTTIYTGDDIVTSEQNQLIDKYISDCRERDDRFNKQLMLIDTNKRGINFYTRPMICQKGGNEFTNYFTHQNRSLAEANVFKMIRNKIESASL